MPRAKNSEPKPTSFELEKSAGAVVFRRDASRQYLLIYARYWEFPKGHIDAQESEVEAAHREVTEETGLRVSLVEGFREELTYFYRRPSRLIKKQVIYFLGETAESEVRLSWEHEDSAWLSYEEALPRLAYEGSRTVLRKAHEFLTRIDGADADENPGH